VPPGSSPIPGTTTAPAPAPPAQPPATPEVPPLPDAQAPAAAATSGAVPPGAAPALGTAPNFVANQPAHVIVTAPAGEFRMGGGPYMVTISVDAASQMSVVNVTLNFSPLALRVRSVQEGSFMRQGAAAASFVQQVDPITGRVDITISRVGDQTGASGSGLLAAVLFEAVGAGTVALQTSGVARTPAGMPIPLTFEPLTVTVR
jgi:hypothetical protein